MTTENSPLTYSLARRSPRREILRHRWSGRRDRALVLRDLEGLYHLLWSRRWHSEQRKAASFSGERDRWNSQKSWDNTAQPAASWELAPSPRLLSAYDSAYHVDLEEHQTTRAVRLPDQYGPPEPVTIRVLWWVHDPVRVVRTQTSHGWGVVCADLDDRVRDLGKAYTAAARSLTTAEITQHLAAPQALDDAGLTYQIVDVRSRDAEDELLLTEDGVAPTFPYAWTANRREEYEFCLQTLRNGPVALAALWLLRQPDQVREVLDWSVHHQKLIQQETDWQDQMAGLLGALSQEEREELAVLLRDRLASLGRRVPTEQEPGRWSG